MYDDAGDGDGGVGGSSDDDFAHIFSPKALHRQNNNSNNGSGSGSSSKNNYKLA